MLAAIVAATGFAACQNDDEPPMPMASGADEGQKQVQVQANPKTYLVSDKNKQIVVKNPAPKKKKEEIVEIPEEDVPL